MGIDYIQQVNKYNCQFCTHAPSVLKIIAVFCNQRLGYFGIISHFPAYDKNNRRFKSGGEYSGSPLLAFSLADIYFSDFNLILANFASLAVVI